MNDYRAIRDPLDNGWRIEKLMWYGWSFVCYRYGDENHITKLVGDLACPQVITARHVQTATV